MPRSPIQRDFRTRAWPSGATVRVRIGIHTGEPSVSEGNYIGMDVHAAARICAVSHGGQIVVSGATRDAAGRDTTETVRFRSLGAQQLRGIPELVPLYQLGAKGLAAKFPPPAEVVTVAHRESAAIGERHDEARRRRESRSPRTRSHRPRPAMRR